MLRLRSLVVAGLMTTAMLALLLPASAGTASAMVDQRTATGVPYGQIVVSGDAWLGGGGVDVVSNLGHTYDGPWQCVELVNRLYATKGWISSTSAWTGNGKDKYATAPASLVKEPQGSITRVAPGDVIVFNTNFFATYGHVAVVDRLVGNGTIQSLSQNAQPADMGWANLTWSGGNLLVSGSAAKVTGIVHAPASSPSRIAVARNKDGRLEMFGVGLNWEIWHRAQTSPGGSWTPWYKFDGAVAGLAAETNADGRIELFAVGLYGEVYHRWQTSPGGSWSGWSQMDGRIHSLAVARNGDGRLELFAVGLRGEPYHRWQTSPGGSWSAWSLFDGRVNNVAAETNADGRIEMFATGMTDEVWRRAQNTPGGSWSAWQRLDGTVYRHALAKNKDGRLELFAIGMFGEVYNRWQTSPGGGWSGWNQFDGRVSNVAAETNADGRLELFTIGLHGEIYHRWQTAPGASWTGWSQFDGTLHT